MKPVLIKRGLWLEGAKEPAYDWMLRCLELDLVESGVWKLTQLDADRATIEDLSGKKKYLQLPNTRVLALESGLKKQMDDHRRGVATVVMGPQAVLMQRKSPKNPTIACRGKLSLIAGSCHLEEDPVIAMIREIYEEVRNIELADLLAGKLVRQTDIVLPSVQWTIDYTAAWFVVETRSHQEFLSWSSDFLGFDGLGEGTPEMILVPELHEMIAFENKHPGSHFVASHHRLLEMALNE